MNPYHFCGRYYAHTQGKMPELHVNERLDSFVEVDQVLDEKEAHREADRCLNCCRICYNPDTPFPIAK